MLTFFIHANLYFLPDLAVTAVANGLQAWKILEDLTNHTDIVLTEVVMPVLSGIGLLCKIMTHKTRKNIPVISKYYSQLLFHVVSMKCKFHFL